jgi:hypothetical protein
MRQCLARSSNLTRLCAIFSPSFSLIVLCGIDRRTVPGLLSVTFMHGVAINLSVPVSTPFPLGRRRAINRLIAAILALAVCCSVVYAGQPKPKKRDNRHEIEQLEEAWRVATLKSDTNAMSALLADDYIAITAYGTLQTKEETLANLRTRRVHITYSASPTESCAFMETRSWSLRWPAFRALHPTAT